MHGACARTSSAPALPLLDSIPPAGEPAPFATGYKSPHSGPMSPVRPPANENRTPTRGPPRPGRTAIRRPRTGAIVSIG